MNGGARQAGSCRVAQGLGLVNAPGVPQMMNPEKPWVCTRSVGGFHIWGYPEMDGL